jgi:diguanylate cyclase (GGDEF)-like protein
MFNFSPRGSNGGLSKRGAFIAKLREVLSEARQHGNQPAVLFVNLDLFRLVNYELSYAAGDQLILEVGERLQTSLGSSDALLHLSADDYAVLVSAGEKARQVAARIQQALSQPFVVKDQHLYLSACIGCAHSNGAFDQSPEDLLRNADIAMRVAKSQGQGSYITFAPSMRVNVVQRADLEREMRRAIEHQEFRVYYQPIVALGAGEFKGFEALLRWEHPQRGMLQAGEFLEVAEETGLIVPISYWVLHNACKQTGQWLKEFGEKLPLSVSVNLSTKQFYNPHLIKYVEHALHNGGVSTGHLRLEISESVLMQNPEQALRQLVQLAELGVLLVLDDFGIGNSSLGWLHRFPMKVLKIDKSFLGRMVGSSKTVGIVQAIVTLGHNLNMMVVAKGVETDEQLERIRELSFDYIQGNYLSEPLDSYNASGWLNDLGH